MKKKKMLKRILSAAVLFSMVAMLVPQTALADNPIVQNNYTADPAPMAYGDTLYLFTSHDEDILENGFYTMKDWKCYSTKDMVNWTDYGTIAGLTDFSWSSLDDQPRAWAAQCVERKGKFYLFVPIHKKNGGMCIGVGVSENPTGPFEDVLGKPLIDNGSWDNIDPTVFIDDDEQAYLFFGNPTLYYVKLNEDMLSYDTSIGKNGIVATDMTEEAFGPKPDSNHKTTYGEGPWFYKRGDLYYMVYAAFLKGQGSEHIAYSTSTSPTGPWEYRGVIMPMQGLGKTGTSFTNHPGVVDFQGHSYLFYHNQGLKGGGSFHRSVSVEEFTYNADGTFPEINMTLEGPAPIAELNPYERTEAETYAYGTKIETEPCAGGMCVCQMKEGSNIKVRNVGFGEKGPIKFHASIASEKDAVMELHLDSADGQLITSINVSNTGGEDQYKTFSTDIQGVTGTHDMYIVFKGEGKDLFKFDYWQFEKEPEPDPTATPEPTPTATAPATAVPTPTIPAVSSPTPSPQEDVTPVKPQKVKGVTAKKQKGNKLKLKWQKVKDAEGYEVNYTTDKKMKKNVRKGVTTKTTCTIKKLKKKKRYYIRVKAYVTDEDGEKIYGSPSAVKKVKM